MTRTVAAALQVAGLVAVAIAAGLAAGLWLGLLVGGAASLLVGVLLELETVRPAAPAAGQPSVSAVIDGLKRKFSRTYTDPRGGRLTTAPPPERDTADEDAEAPNSWVIRGPGR